MRQIITVAAVKGGTGKTSTVQALAECAKRDGRKVLLIDLDAQSSLSIWNNADFSRPGAYEMITGSAAPADCVQDTADGINLICGNADLTALKTYSSSALRLSRALQSIERKYNFILLDTGPAMNEALNNALFCSNGILIPLETDGNSLQAYYQVIDIVRQVQRSYDALKIRGVVLTKYDGRPTINRILRDAIQDAAAADNVPYLGEIRQGIAIREASSTRQPIYKTAPKSKPAADYLELYKKLKG